MRIRIVILVAAAVLLLAGCGREEPAAPVVADFTIPLPEGYTTAPETDASVTILRGEEPVGGICLTELGDDLKDAEDEALFRYIDSYAPMPLMGEYIASFWEEEGYAFISVSLKITDTEADTSRYQFHYLFERGGGIYDLWLEENLVDEDQRNDFLTTAGIWPGEAAE